MKLLKTLKSLKNLQKSKLAKAVAMSLIVGSGVMGVCGSALAADMDRAYFGILDGKKYTFKRVNLFVLGGKNSLLHDFNGSWDSDSGDDDGKADFVVGGVSTRPFEEGREVKYNTVSVWGGEIGELFAGRSNNYQANYNTANIYFGTIGTVFGGYANYRAHGNEVNLHGGTIGTVFGGWVAGNSYDPAAIENIVNIFGIGSGSILFSAPTVENLHGGLADRGGAELHNHLHVYGYGSTAKRIDHISGLHFHIDNIDNDYFFPANTTMLKSVALDMSTTKPYLDTIYINTYVDSEKYKKALGKTVTLIEINSDYVKNRNFRINNNDAEDVFVDSLSSGVDIVGGYDILKDRLNFTTWYKLAKDDVTIQNYNFEYGLKLNGKTLNMQSDPGEAPEYNTLKVKKLVGEGNLAIDVDLAGYNVDSPDPYRNDKIEITGKEDNNATVTVKSVVVRNDLPGYIGAGHIQTIDNKVLVIDGNNYGVTLKVADGAVKSSTDEYIYTFTNGSDRNKLKVTKESGGTLTDFLTGKGKFANVNTYTLTKDRVAQARLGGTIREGEDKELILAFNENVTLYGDRRHQRGINVGPGYTLKLQGVEDGKQGKMTQFEIAALQNDGILEVVDMKLEDNEKDIDNRKTGTLNLLGTNIIHDITNTGTANLDGNNTITDFSNAGTANATGANTIKDLTGEGTFNVNDGTTTVTGVFNTKVVNVNAGTLKLTGGENSFAREAVQGNTVNINGGTVDSYIYGGYGEDNGTFRNTVNVKGGTVNGNVFGGVAAYPNGANQNTVNISGGTINGDVFGGFSTYAGDNCQNTVNISGGTITGDVYGGMDADGNGSGHRNNVVNISGGTVGGKVVGGSYGSPYDISRGIYANNLLHISGSADKAIEVGNIANFQKIEFVLPEVVKDSDVLLKINDLAADTDLKNAEINTTVKGENLTPDTNITLLSAEKSINVSKDKLKINGEAEGVTVKTAVDGLSGAVGAIVGYDVSEKEIRLAINSYKLLGSTDVIKNITLDKELDLNEQTLNMQRDPEEVEPYNTLTVNKLSGKGNLAIDVDFAGNKNDKINICGAEDNNATVNLNSIIVRSELPDEDGKPIIKADNKVTVLEGNLTGINLAVDRVKTATSDSIYTFEKGTDAGKLKVTKVDPGNIAYFIPGQYEYADVNVLTLTKDTNVKADLGTTERKGTDKVLTLAFNADKKLSGDNKAYTGAIVAEGYTLKLQGVDEATPGVMTQFQTAAVTNNGVLEVENMKFVDNDHDIINNGTLKLSGGNTINDIANAGTAELEGKNAITTVTGAGIFDVMAGETAVSGALTQNTVKVTGGNLALNGDINAKFLAVAEKGSLEIVGALNGLQNLTNAGTVTMKSDNTLPNVMTILTSDDAATGSFNVAVGKTVIESGLTQANVKVEKDAELKVGGKAMVANTLDNAGTVSLKGSENEINALTNAGTANLNGSKKVTMLTNTGTANLNDNNTVATLTNEGTANLEGRNTVTTLNNNGTASLKGTNNITTLTNTATANLEGSNNVTTLHNNGIAKLSGADNKIATVVGNGTFNVTDGKTTVEKAFVQKTVNVTGGELELKAPADSFLAGEVQGHAANITGGKVTGHVYGGLSVDNAHENNVNITNGTVAGDVYGGVSYNGNAYKNTVNISGGNISGDVYGALTIDNGTAYANTVNISGGNITGNVYGGINEYGSNNTHHDNVINISGGKVEGTIYGASNVVGANNLLHVTGSNTKPVEVGNIAYLQKLEFTMPQGYNKDQAILTLTNDKDTSLNLNGDKSIVLNSAPEDRLVTGEKVTLIQKINDQASLDLKDNGNAIFDENGTMKAAYANTALYMASPLYILKGKLELAVVNGSKANDLIFVAGKNILDRDDEEVKPEPKPTPVEPDPDDRPKPEPKPDTKPIVPGGDDEPQPIIPVDPEPQPKPTPVDPEPQPTPEPDPQPQPQPIDYDKVYGELMDNVKTAMETRANGAALLNEAGDFLMKQGLSNAKMAAEANKAEGESSMAPFAVIGGGKLRYETGSHVDSKSWHGAVGLAKQVKDLTFGVAVQQGKSNYDAYVNKAHSEGTSKSVGGALFAEKKIANGLHFDAAVRGGRVKNEYNAMLKYSVPDLKPFDVNYKESSTFYGLTLGGGKEFTLKTKDKVDVYGRYAWTHTGSSEATTNWQDELKFDGINSHRILLGSRYTHAVNERNELYAGLGWQYELGGKVKGSSNGYSAPEPSLKGSSGLLELGWKAAAEDNLTVDLNLSGWTGKQRGVMAGVNMQWKF